MNIGSQTVWESLDWPNRELLTPNLPNVFLAVVPAERAAELGKVVKKAIEDEWKHIAEAVWTECQEAGLTKDEGGFTAPTAKAASMPRSPDSFRSPGSPRPGRTRWRTP